MNALPQPPFPGPEPLPRGPDYVPARRKRWRLVAWFVGACLVFLLLLLVVGTVLLHSSKFRTYAVRVVQQKASLALGSPVEIQNLSFGWSGAGLKVEFYGVRAHGAAPYVDPPLLEADSLAAELTITSVLRRTWYINDLCIEHPVLRVLADRQGRTNLPHNRSAQSMQGNNGVFELGIRHLQLDRGEIYYNDLKSALAADVHDLSLQSRFEPLRSRYSGTLAYRNGHVQWQHANPLLHNLDARFAATPEEFTLENAALTTHRSRLSVSVTARNYVEPQIHASYKVLLDSGEFRKALNNTAMPTGMIQLSGVLDYQYQTDRPFLAAAQVKGELHSARLVVPCRQASASIVDLTARYMLGNGNASVDDIRAGVLGGRATGTLSVRDLPGTARPHLAMQLRGISASEIQKLIGPEATSRGTLRGVLDANLDAKSGTTISDLVAKADARLQGGMQPARGGAEIPISSVVHAQYDARGETLSLTQTYLRTPQTSVSLDGRVSKKSALKVRLQSSEVHELESLAAAFQTSEPKVLDLHGQAALVAVVSGSTRRPQVQGNLTAKNLRLHATSWKLLQTRISASPTALLLDQGELVPATRGRITFRLGTDLREWSPTETSKFQIRVDASGLNAGDLTRAAGLTIPVSGTLSADVQASGTQLSPVGQGNIKLVEARIAGETLRSANVRLEGNGSSLSANLRADSTAGSATGSLQYKPKQQAYQVSIRALGIKLEQLETVKAKNLQMTGALNLQADGRGTLHDPALKAKVEIPKLQIRDQVVNGLKLDSEVANRVATLNLASGILGSHVAGHGTVRLTGDYGCDFAVDTDRLALQPIMAMYAPSQAANLNGQTELHATLRGPLKNRSALEAHLVIPQLTVNYAAIQLAAADPIRADYMNGTLEVRRASIQGTGTELTFQAKVPAARNAPVSLFLRGTVDLRIATMLDPDLASTGELRFDIDSFGGRSDPNLQGQIRIVNASLAEAGMPLGLRDVNGILTLTRDRIDVTQFEGKSGGGTITARGGLVYRPALEFELAMKAEGVRALYQQSIRTTLSSDLALTGQYDKATLRGQINVEQLSFTDNFDLMEFTSELGGGATMPPPTGGFTDGLGLQIAIQTPGGLDMSSRALSVAGSADLQLRGTAAQPVMLGRINLRDGELIFSGNRYLVQGGTIDFRNPSRTEPVVDLSANTSIQQYQVQLHFWGPIDHLHTDYSSDPALPPADVINLIAFGKTSEASAANPAPGALGAQSLIASQVSSQVTGRIEKLAGISQLSIDPELGSSQQSPGARIALQQRVTSKIYVTFATDLTSTQQEALRLEYQLNRRASLSIMRDQNGGFSFETSFSKRW